jgi:hypothetical protein
MSHRRYRLRPFYALLVSRDAGAFGSKNFSKKPRFRNF